jgi:hypothetical protein
LPARSDQLSDWVSGSHLAGPDGREPGALVSSR